MNIALVNGQRQTAQPNLLGTCPVCAAPVFARCGTERIWHWAHKRDRLCDKWWESETKWHRTWKDQFPTDWQEIVHRSDTGERHIADVKTDGGWVVEFQHSLIKPEERRSREAFYTKLVWVVDGMRRKRDWAQITNAWKQGAAPIGKSSIRKVHAEDSRLLREWAGCKAPVFFDLNVMELWFAAQCNNGAVYVGGWERNRFVECLRNPGRFDAWVNSITKLIEDHESPPLQPPPVWHPAPYQRRRHFRL
jgi:competence protein CoiA